MMAIKLNLNEQELLVLMLVADGYTYQEIIAETEYKYDDVIFHTNSIRLKLNAKNNANAVAIAYHRGILK